MWTSLIPMPQSRRTALKLNSTEKFFISRYLSAPKRNLLRFSFVFMVLGIVLSVGILSAGLNLFEGYERALKSVLLDSFAHVRIERGDGKWLDAEQVQRVRDKLGSLDEISSITPSIGLNLMAIDASSTRGCIFNAYETPASQTPLYAKYVIRGKAEIQDGQIILGHYLAEEFGLGLGDSLRVLYPQLNRVTPMGIYSGEHLFQIAGIYRSGFYEFDRSLIIGTVTDARSILFTDDLYAYMDIKLKGARIEEAYALAARYNALAGADLMAYPVVGTGLLRTVAMQKWLIFIVFSFLVLIAGINVISAVSTMIFDKKNEIAVLKTLGATARTIRRVVDYQILLVCFGAILIGQAFGAALSWLVVKQSFYHLKGDVYFIDRLEHHISALNLMAVFAVAAALVLVCVWIPSRRIDRLHIIELLRNP